MTDDLSNALRTRYSGARPGDAAVHARVLEVARWYLDKGLGVDNVASRLRCKNDATYWQQLSEVLVARELDRIGLALARQPEGPDFLIEHQGRRIWIEVICPEPKGIPDQWLNMPLDTSTVIDLPHEAILLRWTAAIKEKFEKLAGRPGRPGSGYLANNVVGPEDAYVIAVNGRLLRDRFPQLAGISGFPFAVEATLAVGPYAVSIHRQRMEIVSRGHQHRPAVTNHNGASVAANTFFDPAYAPVSAVWALDFDENVLFADRRPCILVHNPNATNPVRSGLLPVLFEYSATFGTDGYAVTRQEGRLSDGRG